MSSQRSSTSSMPTESRMSPSGTVVGLARVAATALPRRLDAAEARGVRDDVALLGHLLRGRRRRRLEAHDRAEARVADVDDGRMGREPLVQLLGIGLGAVQPHVQRADAARGQPGLHRTGDRALQRTRRFDDRSYARSSSRSPSRPGSRRCARTAAWTPSGRRSRRPARAAAGAGEWRTCCRPRRARRPAFAAGDQRRCRRSRAPDWSATRSTPGRLRRTRRCCPRVVDVDEPQLDLARCALDQARRAVVGVARSDDDGSGRDQPEQRRRGRDARGERQRPPALERAEHRLERVPRRIAVTPVLRRAARHERAGQGDGRVERPAGHAVGPSGATAMVEGE